MRRTISFTLAAAVGTAMLATSITAGADNPHGYAFVTMPDGVKIAVSVRVPEGCTEQSPCPAIFEMSGYDGGGAAANDEGTLSRELGLEPLIGLGDDSYQLTRHFYGAENNGAGDYVIVHASVRGTGCSGGEFDLFTWQGALDGKYIIDSWIPAQPWSNGDVGLIGHSYGGITGMLVAATQPERLRVISVSGLIDDIYRGITYPGGVSNYGFPLLWTGGVRNLYDLGGGLAPRLVRPLMHGYSDQAAECIEASLTRSRSVLNDPIVQGSSDTDTDWFRARSPINHIDKIEVPVHITGAYQDEQTGPRGPAHLWEKVRTPKRLVLTNGDHGTAGLYDGTHVTADRVDWLNHYLHGTDLDDGLSEWPIDPDKPVRVYLETLDIPGARHVPSAVLDSTDFPLPETDWRDLYFAPGELVADPPEGGSADYISGSVRSGWFREFGETAGTPITTAEGPDQLQFATVLDQAQPTVIVGPIMAHLDLSATSIDTELYVEVIDQAPDGTRAYLQRGLLRAAHRGIIPSNSDCVDSSNAHASCEAADALMYRPYRPHVQADWLTPGERYDLLVEIWPLGHVFRPGHELRVLITTPPLFDNYYAYVPNRPVGINTLHFGEGSKITLPVIPAADYLEDLPAQGPACAQQDSVRCVNPGQY